MHFGFPHCHQGDLLRVLHGRGLEGESAWGRPVDLQELPDGSMLVSDDLAGMIYRIKYTK